MKYLAVETWGLCDFRAITAPSPTMAEATERAAALRSPDTFTGMLGREIDPGSWLNIGDWMTAQDGMVCQHDSEEAARRWIRGKTNDALVPTKRGGWRAQRNDEIGGGPIHVGRVAKILRRYKGQGATIVMIEAA